MKKILIIVSNFNELIIRPLESYAILELEKAGELYDIFHVPGAVEIPVTMQELLKKGEYTVAIALGCVIKGKTDHYDFVLRSCIDGLTRVSLDMGIPVIQGIIAAPDFFLAWERRFMGVEYVKTAVKMKRLFAGMNKEKVHDDKIT